MVRRVREPEQSSEPCITRLDSFDEASMQTLRFLGWFCKESHEFTVLLGSTTRVSRLQCQPSQSPLGSIGRRMMNPVSVSSDSCWGEMGDLICEENVEWGLLPSLAAPGAVQTPTDVVEALECDLLELPGSNRHDVDREACAPTGRFVRATVTTCQGSDVLAKCVVAGARTTHG